MSATTNGVADRYDFWVGNKALISNANKEIAESAVTDVEIGYLDGVTSAIQTQINARMSTAAYPDLVAIEALAGTSGFLKKTGANTWSLDTASYALSSAIPVASSITPSALGTASVGTGTTWARADHVHAMPTAAQVGAVPSSSGVVGVMLPSSTSFASSFTQAIFGTTANGYFLREVRANANAPSSLLGNFASGLAWKGEDTYGSLMVAYNSSDIRVSGGNGSNPAWTVDLWHTGKFTQTDLSHWDVAYAHSQIAAGNPHGTTFAQLASKPTTLSGYGITDAPSLTSTNYGTTFEGTDPFTGTNRGAYDGKGGVRTWNGAGPFGSVWYNVVDVRHRNSWNISDVFGGELAWGMTAYTDRLAFRSRNAAGTPGAWTEVWTKANLSNPATGSGEANRMAYWSGANALSSSSKLQFDGSNMLLGNTAGGLLTSLSAKASNSIELICNARQVLSTTGTSTLLDAAANITLAINGASKLSLSGGAISASNTIVPTQNNAYDLGSNTFRFANVHAANVFSGGNAVLTAATNSFAQNISFPSITITDKITCAFISINDSSTYILPDSDPVGTIRIVNGTPVAGWNPKVSTSQYVYLTYSLADGSAYNEQGGIVPVPKRNYMFQKVASDRWCVLGVVS